MAVSSRAVGKVALCLSKKWIGFVLEEHFTFREIEFQHMNRNCEKSACVRASELIPALEKNKSQLTKCFLVPIIYAKNVLKLHFRRLYNLNCKPFDWVQQVVPLQFIGIQRYSPQNTNTIYRKHICLHCLDREIRHKPGVPNLSTMAGGLVLVSGHTTDCTGSLTDSWGKLAA